MRRNRWAVAAAVLVATLAVLGTTEATGVTNVRATVIRIFTPDGTLVVETDDPGVKVTIEGDGDLVITRAGSQEVRLKAGSYRVRATNSVGDSANSAAASAQTYAAATPTGLSASILSTTQINLSWTAPSGSRRAPASTMSTTPRASAARSLTQR